MQKVEGSSPFSRFGKVAGMQASFSRVTVDRRSPPAHRVARTDAARVVGPSSA